MKRLLEELASLLELDHGVRCVRLDNRRQRGRVGTLVTKLNDTFVGCQDISRLAGDVTSVGATMGRIRPK